MIIFGCGPAGLAVALELVIKHNLVVSMIDLDRHTHTVGEVLPPSIKDYMSRYEVLEQFTSNCSLKSDGTSLWWGSNTRQDKDYIYHPHSNGYHVNRVQLVSLLRGAAVQQGIHIIKGSDYFEPKRNEKGVWDVTVKGDETVTINAPVVINATGRSKRLNAITGKRRHHDKLMGCYQYVDIGNSEWEPRLWIEAVTNGWFYTAPLSNNKAVLVYLTDHDLYGNDLGRFIRSQMLEAENTLERIANSTIIQQMRVCPASSSVVDGTNKEGAITVGDASYTSDPLRGQGILQAFKQAKEAGGAVKNYLAGDRGALSQYKGILIDRYKDYLTDLPLFYGLESRWPKSEFWSRRLIKKK